MKIKSTPCTWKHLDMMNVDRGLFRLKYPRCTVIEQHLFPSRPLGETMRRAAEKLKKDYGCKTLSLAQLSKYATLDSVPIDKLIRILRHGTPHTRHAIVNKKQKTVKKEDIKGICQLIMRKLGPAHTEQVYELALCQEFYNRGIPHIRQMPVTTRYDGTTSIPAGIIDIEVDHRFLIELKSGPYADRHKQQLARYMSALRSNGRRVECAMVICFQHDGTVLFRTA